MMEIVKVLKGEYKGLHGTLVGYEGDKAKINIPIDGKPDTILALPVGHFEIRHL